MTPACDAEAGETFNSPKIDGARETGPALEAHYRFHPVAGAGVRAIAEEPEIPPRRQDAGHVPGRTGVPSRGNLMSVTVIIAIFVVRPAPAGQEGVPVFLIGMDDGLNPFVMRRDSEEFKEVVFPLIARAIE